MCDCRKELQDITTWKLKGGEQATGAIIDIAFAQIGATFQSITTSRIELSFASRKKPIVQSIPHNYCPWCGSKYGTENVSETTTPASQPQ